MVMSYYKIQLNNYEIKYKNYITYLFILTLSYITTQVLSRNFADWFTVGEGDKRLVSTFLPTPIVRTTPSVLLL